MTDQKDFQNEIIQRCPHDKENPYVMVNNSLLRDESISPNCRWLIAYLLTNKQGWTIQVKQLINHLKPHMGRTSVYNLIKEAVRAGYMYKEQIIVRNLRQGCRYFVSEIPKFSNNFSDVSISGIPAPGIPESNTLKKEQEEKKEYKKENPLPPKGGPLPRQSKREEKIQRAAEVYTTDTQHNDLLKRCNGSKMKREALYDKLSRWKIGKGITGGAGDYKAITGWVLKSYDQEESSNPQKANESLAVKVIEKFKHKHINIDAKGIEFINGSFYLRIDFTEYGFRDKLLGRLIKMNLDVEGL